MARSSYQRPQDERITEAALAESASKRRLTEAQIARMQQEGVVDQRKLDLAAREIADKMTLGKGELAAKGEDVAQRDRASRLVAAMTLLGYNEKLQTESLSNQQALLSDLAKRPDIPTQVLGQAFKAAGYPALQTSLDLVEQNRKETALQQFVPVLAKPMDPTAREQKYRPQIEAAVGKGGYERALALAYPKEGQVAPALPGGQGTATPAAPAPGADIMASNQRLIETLLKTAGLGDTAGAAGAAVQPQAVNMNNLFGGTYINAARAAGQPYVEGGMVHNPPAGTAGMDYNVSTGQWLPQGREGTINGLPASEAIAQGFTRNLLAGRTARPPETEGARARLGMVPQDQLPTGPQYAGRTTFGPTETPLVNQGLVQGIPKPAGAGELVAPPPVPPLEQLLAVAAPGGVPTPTPAPQQTPTPTPPMSEAEAMRQAEIRRMLEEEARRRAAMARQQGE